ncbi:MAG TPA: hypothetical protein VF147_16755 [Vicinamibacterales bacterium]
MKIRANGRFMAAAIVVLIGCGLVSKDEVARVASPDGRVEGVVIETNGGATTSFGYEVHVVPKGQRADDEVAFLYGAVRNEHAYGVNLRWVTDSELVIEYLSARGESLQQDRIRVAGRTIKIALRSGVSDPAAPAGGMADSVKPKRQ